MLFDLIFLIICSVAFNTSQKMNVQNYLQQQQKQVLMYFILLKKYMNNRREAQLPAYKTYASMTMTITVVHVPHSL